ncbi:hypothetical protein BLNAU_10749 [Blattamonas nauphoetae]|uniref:Uncharacterized protein n=1 Tax=Blattamonas nauphoetae TaxID=2049346 RepID=A0ABQ9XT03_9EUKA|nr:hypothetical protein BLNAU_10749 [Blattamonas nauphoetae]
MDCSPFLNWDEDQQQSGNEQAVVFRSLVATMKFQSSLDDALEVKAVKFLESVNLDDEESADAFLGNLASFSDEYLADFVQSIMVLISSPNRVITVAVLKMVEALIRRCSVQVRLAVVKADLIPQLINSLNPLSLSFAEAVDIHPCLLSSIRHSSYLESPRNLTSIVISDVDEPPTVYETIFQQVVAPSEKYIWHLCVNRYSIIDEELSDDFLRLLARLL